MPQTISDCPRGNMSVMDTDDADLVLYHQRRRESIERKLMEAYAREIARLINKAAIQPCAHQMGNEEKLWRYFEWAIQHVSENKVITTFIERVSTLSPRADTF